MNYEGTGYGDKGGTDIMTREAQGRETRETQGYGDKGDTGLG